MAEDSVNYAQREEQRRQQPAGAVSADREDAERLRRELVRCAATLRSTAATAAAGEEFKLSLAKALWASGSVYEVDGERQAVVGLVLGNPVLETDIRSKIEQNRERWAQEADAARSGHAQRFEQRAVQQPRR